MHFCVKLRRGMGKKICTSELLILNRAKIFYRDRDGPRQQPRNSFERTRTAETSAPGQFFAKAKRLSDDDTTARRL